MGQIRKRPAGEAGRQNSAGRQRDISGEAKDTTKNINPGVLFVLPIDDRYRLTADEFAWRIERRKGNSWRPIAWHPSIEGAVNDLGRRLVRTSQVQCLADCPSVSRSRCTHA
jgi:hypothetical protein